ERLIREWICELSLDCFRVPRAVVGEAVVGSRERAAGDGRDVVGALEKSDALELEHACGRKAGRARAAAGEGNADEIAGMPAGGGPRRRRLGQEGRRGERAVEDATLQRDVRRVQAHVLLRAAAGDEENKE